MKRIFAFVALLSFGAHADEDWIETTAALSGASVTFAATLNPGAEYYVTCSAATRYRTCAGTPCTADATKDMPLAVDVPIPIIPRSGRTKLAVIAASGTCQLHDSVPRLSTINRQ